MNFTANNIDQPVALCDEIRLHPGRSSVPDQWTEFNGEAVVRNVVSPTLIPIHPPAGVAHRGESVIVAPGGGMLVLSIENEGLDVARKLADQGYSAYVLKYRVNATPFGVEGFIKSCQDFFQDKMSNGFGCADPHLETGQAVNDLLAAVAWVRKHGEPSNQKLHFVGFSAGAKVCIDALGYMKSPDTFASIGLIYFSLSHPGLHGVDLPPLFTAMANDDPLFSLGGFGLLQRWQEAEQALEFHYFKSGGHGFGARRQGTTSDQWLDLYVNWLGQGGAVHAS
jgi:acetyl esterase/lipase